MVLRRGPPRLALAGLDRWAEGAGDPPSRRAGAWSRSRARSSPCSSWPGSPSARRTRRAPSTRSSRSRARSIPAGGSRERLAEVGNNGRLDHWKVALKGTEQSLPARHRRRDLREPLGQGPARGLRRAGRATRSTSRSSASSASSGSSSSSRSCSRSSAARCQPRPRPRSRGRRRRRRDRPHVGAARRAGLGLGDAGRHGLGAHHRRRAARAARAGRQRAWSRARPARAPAARPRRARPAHHARPHHAVAGAPAGEHPRRSAPGDCSRRAEQALDANSALSVRPEPFLVIGFCDVRIGQPKLGVQAMQAAIDRDPDNWTYRYGLALTKAAAGHRPAARRPPRARDEPALAAHPRRARALRQLGPRGLEAALGDRPAAPVMHVPSTLTPRCVALRHNAMDGEAVNNDEGGP